MRTEVYPWMSAQLLVLLLALVMEDQNVGAPALLQHLAGDQGFHFGLPSSFAAGYGEHIAKLHVAIAIRDDAFYPHYVPGRHPFVCHGANDRVHRYGSANPAPWHTYPARGMMKFCTRRFRSSTAPP